ncbi:MAG: potassium transporter Trk, partial [Leptospira sp.]|nr:potassium transporter Trk [Leptospira sp.]
SIVSDAIDSTEEANITKKYKSREVRRILFSIINISLTLELMGAISIYFLFPDDLPQGVDRLFFSIFTSVSSFNNAGFSIIDDLSIILHEPLSIYLVSSLIILGGLGFPVIIYLEKWFLQTIQKFFYHLESKFETIFYHQLISNSNISKNTFFYEQLIKLSHIMDEKINSYNSQLHGESNRIQNKILFIGTILLLSIGTGLILIFEWNNYNTIYDMSFADKLANSFFISVCSRTAGFATMDLVGLYDSSIVLIILLMIIGGGSQGTAGGIKITTFAILFVYLKNVINPGKPVKIFGEIVSKNSVAISIRVYFLATVTMVLLMLLLSILDDSQFNLHANAFELVSAFSTVGFSLGITPDLKEIEKLLYVFIMFIGRIGIFTVLIAITGSSGTPKIENDDGVKIQVG